MPTLLQEAPVSSFNPDPDAPVMVDYMVPGQGVISMGGSHARMLLDNELDVGCMRPYIDRQGRSAITRNVIGTDQNGRIAVIPKKVLTRNDTNATLRFLDWIQL